MVLACDVKILKLREADAREEADEAQSDADYAACVARVHRALSDHAALHRRCPMKVCIRARRCAGEKQSCLSLLAKPVVSRTREQQMIDDLYYNVQAERLSEEEGA
ncbi:MAG: hypothetical protein JSS22_04095 [Proteobacteria bacterium]|nr:hypothetical protein [Pseudomonadota bacterium]